MCWTSPLQSVPDDGFVLTLSSCGVCRGCTSASSRIHRKFLNQHAYASRVAGAENLRRQVGLGLDNLLANGNRNGLGAALHSEFAVTTRQMGLHRAGTD